MCVCTPADPCFVHPILSHARLPFVGSQHAWLPFGQQFPGNRVFPGTWKSHWPTEAVEVSAFWGMSGPWNEATVPHVWLHFVEIPWPWMLVLHGCYDRYLQVFWPGHLVSTFSWIINAYQCITPKTKFLWKHTVSWWTPQVPQQKWDRSCWPGWMRMPYMKPSCRVSCLACRVRHCHSAATRGSDDRWSFPTGHGGIFKLSKSWMSMIWYWKTTVTWGSTILGNHLFQERVLSN